MKNQPSPSLISLSPLIASHPRALRRSWVRSSVLTPVNLLASRSLGFGRDPSANKQPRPTCWPIIQKVRGHRCDGPLIVYLTILTRLTPLILNGSLSTFLHSTNILSFTLQIILLEVDLLVQRNKIHLLKHRKNVGSIPSESFGSSEKLLWPTQILCGYFSIFRSPLQNKISTVFYGN